MLVIKLVDKLSWFEWSAVCNVKHAIWFGYLTDQQARWYDTRSPLPQKFAILLFKGVDIVFKQHRNLKISETNLVDVMHLMIQEGHALLVTQYRVPGLRDDIMLFSPDRPVVHALLGGEQPKSSAGLEMILDTTTASYERLFPFYATATKLARWEDWCRYLRGDSHPPNAPLEDYELVYEFLVGKEASVISLPDHEVVLHVLKADLKRYQSRRIRR